MAGQNDQSVMFNVTAKRRYIATLVREISLIQVSPLTGYFCTLAGYYVMHCYDTCIIIEHFII